MADPLHSTDIHEHPQFTSTTPTTSTVTFTIPSSQIPCKVCEGRGLVYGLDGKPYLCPKCDGDKIDKNKTVYPYQPTQPFWWTWPQIYFGDPTPDQLPITIC